MRKLEEYAPNERRIVRFVKDEDYNNLEYKEAGKELLTNSEVLLVPMKRTEEFLDEYTIVDGIEPYDGMTLIVSPYDRAKYSEVEKANENFAIDRFANILRLCHILGAKDVKIGRIFTLKNSQKDEIKAEAKYKVVKASVENESTYLNEMVNKLLYKVVWSGGESDYEAAKKYLRKVRMGGDRFLEELVEMRNISNNKLESVKQEISLSNNMESTNELLAKISFPMGNGKFERNTKKISEEKYYSEIQIKF